MSKLILLKNPIPITDHIWPEGTLPLVVISTLTYNHEPYIRDAIEGFLMQECDFESLIISIKKCTN